MLIRLINRKKKRKVEGNVKRLFPNRMEILSYFIFIYLFLAALGLRCCTWAFSSCVKRGLLFIAVHGLLIAVASLVVEHGL